MLGLCDSYSLQSVFVFADADLRSEATTGMIVIGIAVLLMITRRQESVSYIVPILVGLGVGLIGSRFLLFFIKMSDHCQRGTSQSTFLLAWGNRYRYRVWFFLTAYSILSNRLSYGFVLVF